MTRIKFCGLTRPEDAAFAAELGASHVGVIFATGPRQISIETAKNVFRAAGITVQRVGVFSDASPEEIGPTAQSAGLHVVQLHRDVDDGFIDSLRKSFAGDIWPVIGVGDLEEAVRRVDDVPVRSNAVVLDSAVNGKSGGTGKPFDWSELSRLLPDEPGRIPVVVGGGLTPENVATAIAALHPDIVDVSSGVESSPGVKDHNLMRAFAEAVHSASIV